MITRTPMITKTTPMITKTVLIADSPYALFCFGLLLKSVCAKW